MIRFRGHNGRVWQTGWFPVLIVLGIVLSMRLLHFFSALHSPMSYQLSPDENFYLRFANAVASGGSGSTVEFAFLDPIYGYIVGLVFKLFGEDVFKVYALQICLDTFTAFCLILIGREFGRPRAGLLAGLVYGVTATAVLFCATLLKTTWVANFMVVWVLAGLVLLRRPRLYFWLLFGVLCGYGIALRSTLLLMAASALVLLPLLSLFPERRRVSGRVFGVGLLMVGIMLPLILLAVRNFKATGIFSPLSNNSGIVLHTHYNVENPSGNTWVPPFVSYRDPLDMQIGYTKEATRRLGRDLSPREVDRYWRGEAIRYIQTHPLQVARNILQKLSAFMAYPEIPNNRFLADERLFSPVLRLLPSPFGWLFALGVPGLVMLMVRDRRAWLMAAPIATMLVTVSVFAPISRYRFQAVPIFALGTGFFLDSLWCYLAQKKIRRAAVMLLIAVALGGVSIWCGGFVRLPPHRWDKAVNGYLKMGDWQAAKELALKAVAEQPENYRLHEALAAIARNEGDYSAAEDYYRRALEIKPNSHTVHYNFARMLSAMGRHQEAVAHALAAVKISPRPEYRTLLRDLISEKQTP